ncbi:hypothetical protein ACTI_79070 [Actinoplanes sp. OR16]|uniref:DUF6232 family protein n=1 Tax=Actinoplanes sp. OR16 TaxID=946334 RepID=UPI000F6DADD9|nr:DUF6232 family protein [Actinoplanes sp. OR16]BBH71222.1 hypothetical protein ACTI_79070 [Actinoplanes sp. OR16]
MSVFYRGPRVLITDEFFEVAGLRRFPVRALRDVHIVRYQAPGAGAHQVMGLSALAGAVVAIPLVGRESAVLGAVIVIVLLVHAAFSLSRRPPPRWDLVAVCGQEYARLFSSSDQREFEQVCRGLQRSLERLAREAG